MKKLFTLVFFSLVAMLLISPAISLGANVEEAQPVVSGNADCFDYYDFPSVQISIGSNKDEYKPGEKMVLSGEITNENNYPVIDGYVFVRVSKKNSNYVLEGNYVSDEFFAFEKMNLDSKEKKEVSFGWSVPNGAVKGDYQMDYFFSVGKRFNLGGLPFTNEIKIGVTNFSVVSQNVENVYFDRSGTKVNSNKYRHVGVWPTISSGQKVEIEQPIINPTSKSKNVKILYDLFYWDSLNEADKIISNSEEVVVNPKTPLLLKYVIPEMKETVYYLRVTAEFDEGDKSIVNIRVTSDQEHPRVNYVGLTNFPIAQGSSADLFACFHNSAIKLTEGRITVLVQDKNDEQVGFLEYKGAITSSIMAQKEEILASKDYNYLKLTTNVYDKNGALKDSYVSVYDCKFFNKCPNEPEIVTNQDNIFTKKNIISVILAVVILGLAFFFFNKKRNVVPTLLFIVIASSLFCVPFYDASAANSKSVTITEQYGQNYLDLACGDSGRRVAIGDIGVTHIVDMIAGGYSVTSGEAVNFSYIPEDPYFYATGGYWDTPYGRWCSNTNLFCAIGSPGTAVASPETQIKTYGTQVCSGNCEEGYVFWTAVKPMVSMSSSDPSIVSCAGMNCTALKGGVVTLTADIGNTTARIWSYIKQTAGFSWIAKTSSYLRAGGYAAHCESGYPTYKQQNTTILPSTSLTWTITVADPPVVTPACSDVNRVANITWDAISGYSSYQIRLDTDQDTSNGFWYKNVSTTSNLNAPEGFRSYNVMGFVNGTLFPGYFDPNIFYSVHIVYLGTTNIVGPWTSFSATAICPPTPVVTPRCKGVDRVADASWGSIPGYSNYQVRLDTDQNVANGFWYKNVAGTLSNNNVPEGFLGYGGFSNFSGYLNPANYNVQLVYYVPPWSSAVSSPWKSFTATPTCNPVCGDTYCNPPEVSTTCPQDCTCKSLDFKPTTSSITPSSVAKGANYVVKCDYGSAGIDSIGVTTNSGSCVFANFTGTVANFNCTAGATPGSFPVSCKLNAGTTSDNCTQVNLLGNLTVNAICPDTLCDGSETKSTCPQDCGNFVFELSKSGDPVVYIDSSLPGTEVRKSNSIKITATPESGFTNNIGFTAGPATPVVADAVYTFNPITLSSVTVAKSTDFYVTVPNSTTAGFKKITITGTSGSGATLVQRTVDVLLKVVDINYENK